MLFQNSKQENIINFLLIRNFLINALDQNKKVNFSKIEYKSIITCLLNLCEQWEEGY